MSYHAKNISSKKNILIFNRLFFDPAQKVIHYNHYHQSSFLHKMVNSRFKVFGLFLICLFLLNFITTLFTQLQSADYNQKDTLLTESIFVENDQAIRRVPGNDAKTSFGLAVSLKSHNIDSIQNLLINKTASYQAHISGFPPSEIFHLRI